MRRGAVFLTLWLGVALVAIGVGTWALSQARIGGDLVAPLSNTDVNNELDAANPDASTGSEAAPTPSESPSPSTGTPRGESTPGGSVVASCLGDRGEEAFLVTWSAAPGYWADHENRGPAAEVGLEFESDTGDDVEVTARCTAGVPEITWTAEFDDHGGGRDDGNRGRGGGDDWDDDNSGHGSGK